MTCASMLQSRASLFIEKKIALTKQNTINMTRGVAVKMSHHRHPRGSKTTMARRTSQNPPTEKNS